MRTKAEARKKTRVKGTDWMLILIVGILTVLGILMQYSASEYDWSIVKRSCILACVGLVLMFVASYIPIRFYQKISMFVLAATFAMTAATIVLGTESKGATRWIKITSTLSFQPSEFLKIGVILGLASIICKYINDINNLPELRFKVLFRNIKEKNYGEFPNFFRYLRNRIKQIKSYIFILLVTGLSGFVVAYITKDLGTALIIVGIGVVMLLIISPRPGYMIPLSIVGLGAVAGLILSQSYRADRIAAWLHLEENQSDLGFQIKQGLYAIGSGGLLGKGLGKSVQKAFIPEAHTDMIYAVVCEELGLIGGLTLIGLYVMLLLRCKTLYNRVTDLFGKMIIAGVATHIALQAAINMAVLTNLLPNTGIPLPFISYGGTSVLCLLAEIGLVLAVNRAEIKKEAETAASNRRKRTVLGNTWNIEGNI